MCRRLVSWAGPRISAVVALLYLAGLIAPAAALALTGNASAAYCFDDIIEIASAPVASHVHVHADGTVHHHADHNQVAAHAHAHDTGQGAPHHHANDADCCGAFGFSAVLPGLSVITQGSRVLRTQQPLRMDCLVGRGPARIDRPPIILSAM